MKKDFLTIKDLTGGEIRSLIDRGLEIKKGGRENKRPLAGRTLGLMFDKSSTRTRISFETAMFRLGGQTLFMSRADTQLSRGEAVKDTARVLSRYLDIIAVRTYAQELVEEMAFWAEVPVINALTDQYHPCQILSDLMTVKEKRGTLENMKVAWIGDGNNVAHSWINAAGVLGFELVLACPPQYYPNLELLEALGKNISVVEDPTVAALGADVINTDVWVSMGQDTEREQRLASFKGFQLDSSLIEFCNTGCPGNALPSCSQGRRNIRRGIGGATLRSI